MKLKKLALLVLCAFVFTACGGGGGGGDNNNVVNDDNNAGCIAIGDAAFNGGSFEVYDTALSYVYSLLFDFTGTTLSFSGVGTDSPNDAGNILNVAFGNDRTATAEGLTFARSCNDQYLTFGINDVDDKFLSLFVNNGFNSGNNSLADGDYTMIQLMDDERNTGSYVFSDVFDLSFNGDGTGLDTTNNFGFNYNISPSGTVTFTGETDSGQISEDGGVMVIRDYNDNDDAIHLSVVVKKSAGKTNATLDGSYNYTEIDGDDGNGSPFAADITSSYGTITFNGNGTCSITDTVEGTFACTYNVSDNGTITFSDGFNNFVGMVSPDSNLVSVARDNSANGGSFMVIALKK